MNDEKKEFKKIEYRYPLFQSEGRLLVMGNGFLGVNSREVERCLLFKGPQERSIRVGGEEVRIRIDSEITGGLLTTDIRIQLSRPRKSGEAVVATIRKIRGGTVKFRNWPLMFFKPKEMLLAREDAGGLQFLVFDKVSLRILNKPLTEGSGFGPRVVWNHRYQDGDDQIKLVYLEYRRMKWEQVWVVDDRQYIDQKITPGESRWIYLLRPARANGAAELWVYRNGKRAQSFVFENYVRRRSRDYTFSGYR